VRRDGGWYLVVGDALLDFADVVVEDSAHVLGVGEDEGSVDVETAGKDVLAVLDAVFDVFLDLILLSLRTSKLYSPLKKNFSSSVIWMTTGTLKASWRYLVKMKGNKWPRCIASEEGPENKEAFW
jgi:sulfate adenylyltransferase subunit 1 (EFTu-like GTPase family)